MKWVLMVFVGSSMPASVGHFSTRDACLEAILQVRIPDFDARGKIEGFASLDSHNMTMFCVPVERLIHEKAAGAAD